MALSSQDKHPHIDSNQTRSIDEHDIPYFSLIFGRLSDGGFGVDNHIPWKHPGDMSFFRKATTGTLHITNLDIIKNLPLNVLIMGRLTWESFDGKPLPNRHHIVVTSQGDYFASTLPKNCQTASSLYEALHLAASYKSTIFVIGGVQLLTESMTDPIISQKVERIYETTITTDTDIKCDVYFNQQISSDYTQVETIDLGTSTPKNVTDPVVQASVTIYHRKIVTDEHQYIDLASKIIEKAVKGEKLRDDRTKVKTYSLFGPQIEFDLSKGFPLLTTKSVPFRVIKIENMWFWRGDTNIDYLVKNNVRIWDANTSRQFLDKNGFVDYPEGELGPGYGYQYRKFGKPYQPPTRVKKDSILYIISIMILFMFCFSYLEFNKWNICPCLAISSTVSYIAYIVHDLYIHDEHFKLAIHNPNVIVSLLRGLIWIVCLLYYIQWLHLEPFHIFIMIICGTISLFPIYDREIVPLINHIYEYVSLFAIVCREIFFHWYMPMIFLTSLALIGLDFLGFPVTTFIILKMLLYISIFEVDKMTEWYSHFSIVSIDIYNKVFPDSFGGIDQLTEAINMIKTDPYSRRILVSAWNPVDIAKTSLPPCHVLFQFYVDDGSLSCKLYQRSCDLFLGAPFNIAGYSLLIHTVAHMCNLKPGMFIYSLGDVHIYSNTIEQMMEQVSRPLRPFPSLIVNKDNNIVEPGNTAHDIQDITDFVESDFTIVGYKPHPLLPAKMAV
jgi:thymidylate synthase/dihydrofolate reductase